MSGSMLFNLPNMLTLSRIVAIPLVVACFWLDRGWAQWFSMALFVTAAVTDWFDGYFARRYHQISRFGRFLDPIADKLFIVLPSPKIKSFTLLFIFIPLIYGAGPIKTKLLGRST